MSVSRLQYTSMPVSHTVASGTCPEVLVCEHAVEGGVCHVRYRCTSCGAVGREFVGPRHDFGIMLAGAARSGPHGPVVRHLPDRTVG